MTVIKTKELAPEERIRYAEKMRSCDWDAGRYLGDILLNDEAEAVFGEGSQALLLTENGGLLSFCTYAVQDEIDDMTLTPWIGFVYTFPEHRGQRLAGVLIDCAKRMAQADGHDKIYVSSEEKGLYEKYGFTYLKDMPSVHGYITQVFVCGLTDNAGY